MGYMLDLIYEVEPLYKVVYTHTEIKSATVKCVTKLYQKGDFLKIIGG